MSSQVYRVAIVHQATGLEHKVREMLAENQGVAFEVLVVESVPPVWENLAQTHADAVLLELPPHMNKGLDLIASARFHIDSVPILAVLDETHSGILRQALSLGATDYLFKQTLSGELLRASLRYIIECHRAKTAARHSERRFEELFENSRDILFTVNLEGQLTSVNKAAEELTGWRRKEILNKSIRDLVAPEHVSACSQMMQRILTEGPLPHFEMALLRKDGSRVFLEASVRVIGSKGKQEAIQGIARDVTERRHLESQLRQVQKLEAIGRLSGGLAHDFNNLLCVISGHTEILTERILPSDASFRSLTQIKKAADSAAALTRQLLAFSRKQVFQPRTMDLNAIVLETERLLGRLIGEHIEFYSALDPALSHVHVDPVQIEQVLVNLVLNARDAMPDGGKLTIETSNISLEENHQSKRSLIPAGNYVLLAVSDTGCGMDEETQSRLFEPFYTTKELGKGTGLGLATVYGIVKQSGGFVWVYSELRRGTTFKIYLPRVEGAAEPLQSSKRTSQMRKGTETILLVEDAAPLRALAKEFLQDAGYTVLEAADGNQAIRIARYFSGPIHLLLTDVVMPGIGGKQLADQLANVRPAAKVLFMSGYPDDAIVQSGTLVNGVALLEKPFTREILRLRVRQVLDSAKETSNSRSAENDAPHMRDGSIEAT